VLKVGNCLSLAILGLVIGRQIAATPQSILLGGLLGGLVGWLLGDVLWDRRPNLRWDWIGTGAVVILFTWLAYLGCTWLGENWPGQFSGKLANSIATWLESLQVDRIWISILMGILGGGASGAISGSLTEVLAEIIGFRK
jgi:hypothetical protein